jgi:Rieske Fe-S protein
MKQQLNRPETPLLDDAAQSSDGPSPERRTLLRVAGVTGVVGVVGAGLAACGGSSSGTSSAGAPTSAAATTTAGSSAGAGTATTTAAAGGSNPGTELSATSQIPVGGGMIFSDQKVVVTQPVAGTFKAFSSTCTHMGCQVNQVTNGLIECPCHGSHFSIADGSVKAGPAPSPLPAEPITVQGGQIFLTA